MFHARQRTGRRSGSFASGRCILPVRHNSRHQSSQGCSHIEAHHGVQLESLSATVWGGQALPDCEKGLSSWAQARHRTAEKISLLRVPGSPVDCPPHRHLKKGESAAESLRKSDTKMQVCNCFPSQGTSLSSPLPASQAGERQNIGPRQTWFEAKFQDSWG